MVEIMLRTHVYEFFLLRIFNLIYFTKSKQLKTTYHTITINVSQEYQHSFNNAKSLKITNACNFYNCIVQDLRKIKNKQFMHNTVNVN